jgi:hypothetical protein
MKRMLSETFRHLNMDAHRVRACVCARSRARACVCVCARAHTCACARTPMTMRGTPLGAVTRAPEDALRLAIGPPARLASLALLCPSPPTFFPLAFADTLPFFLSAFAGSSYFSFAKYLMVNISRC